LVFWTDGDADAVDRLFRQSGLYREKWERDDYRTRTIDLALATLPPGGGYTGGSRNGSSVPASATTRVHTIYADAPQQEEAPAVSYDDDQGPPGHDSAATVSDAHDRSFPLLGADGQVRNDAEAPREQDHSHLLRRGKDNSFPLLSMDDLAKLGTSKPEALLAGKLMRRTLALLYGTGGVGKSYYMQDACFDLAADGRRIWYVAAEGFDGIYLRMLAWKAQPAHQGRSLDTFRVIPLPVNIFRAPDVKIISAQACALSEDRRPDLIVLDTLHRCAIGANEQDNRDMACLGHAATVWRVEAGLTTLAMHHEGKSAGRGPRGASCLYDDADTVIYLFRGGNISVVECEKQKDFLPAFEPQAFTLDSFTLEHHGFPGMSAQVVRHLPSDQVVVARQLWTAEQARRSSGKNGTGEDDDKVLKGVLATAYEALVKCHERYPSGVFQTTWRAAFIAAGGADGSFDHMKKELLKRGKVTQPDTTGSFLPVPGIPNA
jgi:hypothetical protein